jgi:hypothetical protein
MSYKQMSDDEKGLIDEIDKYEGYKKFSKGAFFLGITGLVVSAVNYYFNGEPSSQTLNQTLNQMNNLQLTDTAIFALSSVGYFGGGLMYSLFGVLQKDLKNRLEEERAGDLENKLKK